MCFSQINGLLAQNKFKIPKLHFFPKWPRKGLTKRLFYLLRHACPPHPQHRCPDPAATKAAE